MLICCYNLVIHFGLWFFLTNYVVVETIELVAGFAMCKLHLHPGCYKLHGVVTIDCVPPENYVFAEATT